ncbi:hypothetical protein DFH06DRAFT_1343057 [Mycena polygramma]|nr:hypothetical protein DFH06DRAFT_1343057 [Mycena polygramma]
MTDTSAATAPSASTPQQELEALVARVAALSQMSLAMAKHCLDVQTKLPIVFNAAVEAGVGPLIPSPPAWVLLTARTPDELDAAHPPAPGLNEMSYHVVSKGREPGLYASVEESDYQVLGVPGGRRLKVTTRLAALAYYRERYDANEVQKWGVVESSTTPASTPAPAPSSSASS